MSCPRRFGLCESLLPEHLHSGQTLVRIYPPNFTQVGSMTDTASHTSWQKHPVCWGATTRGRPLYCFVDLIHYMYATVLFSGETRRRLNPKTAHCFAIKIVKKCPTVQYNIFMSLALPTKQSKAQIYPRTFMEKQQIQTVTEQKLINALKQCGFMFCFSTNRFNSLLLKL